MHGSPKVLVAGAGLAGLAAARALEARGAAVTVIEAQDRVGGRVWTIRDGFADRQHAEAGADLIDSNQRAILDLADELGLKRARILRRGFGYYGLDPRGRRRIQPIAGGFGLVAKMLWPLVADYQLAERRWDGAIARGLARESVADWLNRLGASDAAKRRVRGFRGLFLADPEELSLIALVDFFADMDDGGWGETFRIAGGNDRIATETARRLRGNLHLRTILRAVRQGPAGIIATVDGPSGRSEVTADFLVVALPASTARDVTFDPALPEPQREAIARLRYGRATRLLLQFPTRFWTRRGRPNAFGSDLPVGAFWDGNEQDRAGPAILSFLAGGGASVELQEILKDGGPAAVLPYVQWLRHPVSFYEKRKTIPGVISSRTIVWEDDPWARGGYAFFDPGFDPLWRDWLARPHGRVLFAGEHTSIRWQGYMNGAVESGRRAAAEVGALASRA